MQHAAGLSSSAIFSISSVIPISRLSLVFKTAFNVLTSASLMCLLSSLKWVVIPATPTFSQILAHSIKSGSTPPLALRNVAIWSIFTPSNI